MVLGKQYYQGFWIEKRGKRYYGFCDDACPVIVRDFYWHCVKAMERHRWEHDGQASLLALLDSPPLPKDAAPPF